MGNGLEADAREFDLETIISPLEPIAFLREVWGKQPCVVSRSDPKFYSELFSIADIDSVLQLTCHNPSQNDVAVVKTDEDERTSRFVQRISNGTPDIYSLYQAYDAGYTIIVNDLQARWGPIAALCRRLQESLRHPVGANLYFTPKQSQGFTPHFDTHDVFILQLTGDKRWLLYDFQSGSLPLADAHRPVVRDEIGAPRQEILLTAGDVLYIPRGHIHEAVSTDGSSLHLTVGINVHRWVDLVREALLVAAEKDLRLRESVPTDLLRSDVSSDEIAVKFRELLFRVDWDSVGSNAAGRLLERQSEIGRPPPDGHFCSLDRVHEIDGRTMLFRRPSMGCSVLVEDGKASINFPGNKVTGPLSIEPALEFIAKTDRFCAGDLPGFLTDEGKLVLVRRLIREGLLSIAERDPYS